MALCLLCFLLKMDSYTLGYLVILLLLSCVLSTDVADECLLPCMGVLVLVVAFMKLVSDVQLSAFTRFMLVLL